LQDYPALREQIEKELEISRPTVDKTLKIIQTFEPDGVGARNLKECLLIQLVEHNFENADLQEIIETIIEKHLEDLAAQNYAKIAAALNIREEGVVQVGQFIRNNLNPKPGSRFGKEELHIVPSFSLQLTGGKLKVINLEERYGPKLKLSAEYENMLSSPLDEKTRNYLKEKLARARDLIDGIKKRQETQNKIASRIVDEQLLFLQKGTNWVKPLLQKTIAEELGVHPSTVSRALSEKYIQTPKGIFHLKFLCQRSWLGVPKTRLKELIEEVIQNAAQTETVSDEKIRQKLAEHGIVASRRTIAEYRRQLEIPSSKERSKAENPKS
jgi:RNA polymerase sigma-54 factor